MSPFHKIISLMQCRWSAKSSNWIEN